MRYCGHCGSPMGDSDTFCTECGTKFNATVRDDNGSINISIPTKEQVADAKSSIQRFAETYLKPAVVVIVIIAVIWVIFNWYIPNSYTVGELEDQGSHSNQYYESNYPTEDTLEEFVRYYYLKYFDWDYREDMEINISTDSNGMKHVVIGYSKFLQPFTTVAEYYIDPSDWSVGDAYGNIIEIE